MAMVATTLGAALSEVQDGREDQKGNWSIVIDPSTGSPSGSIRIHLGCSEDAKRLENTLHEHPIRLGNELVAIHVTNAALTHLPQCNLGNGEGGPPTSRGDPMNQ